MLSASDFKALQGFLHGNSPTCSPKILEKLVRGRMLIADDVDELKLLRRRYETTQSEKKYLGLTLIPSLGCNFDCPYCFEDKFPSVMDERTQRAVMRLVDDQLPKIDKLSVSWFGGEPLVGKKALMRLSNAFIEHCDRAHVEYSASIITNGYLLTEETCRQLKDAKVSFAQVTIDGPPEVHDRMRPLVNGAGTFWKIVNNLHHAVKYLAVGVRVNIDAENFHELEALLRILADEGFRGKLSVNLGQIVAVNDGHPAPSATYKPACLKNAEFAQIELEFARMAERYGFGSASLPRPTGAPCTAVRVNELVIGSKGELYKCWESVGNPKEVIGHIADYDDPSSRTSKWLKYDPFSNQECRSCIALPVCMGGCAHHAMDPLQYENRCGTFRHTFREQVLEFVERASEQGLDGVVPANSLVRRMETR
jgi:uncharacterized protein